jgi:hypothetical protein
MKQWKKLKKMQVCKLKEAQFQKIMKKNQVKFEIITFSKNKMKVV